MKGVTYKECNNAKRHSINSWRVSKAPSSKGCSDSDSDDIAEDKQTKTSFRNEFIRRCRVFVALTYYFCVMRLRRKILLFVEIVFPILLVIIFVVEVTKFESKVVKKSLFTSSSSDSTGNTNNPINYRLCPFGAYGALGQGWMTEMLLAMDSAGPNGLGDIGNLVGKRNNFLDVLCDPNLINDSPFIRPVYHFSRTFDRKYLAYMPVLLYLHGSVIFSDQRLRDVEDYVNIPDASNCQKMHEFFDIFLLHTSPYFALARESIFVQQSLDETLSYWTEANDMNKLLMLKFEEFEANGLSRFLPIVSNDYDFVYDVLSLIIRFPCVNSEGPLCLEITRHFTSEKEDNYELNTKLSEEVYPLYALIYCDKESTAKDNLGSLSFTLRMNESRNSIITTRGSPIVMEGKLIPYDGSFTSMYHFGKVAFKEPSEGGFLSFQNLIYSYVFNSTGALLLDDVKTVSYKNREQWGKVQSIPDKRKQYRTLRRKTDYKANQVNKRRGFQSPQDISQTILKGNDEGVTVNATVDKNINKTVSKQNMKEKSDDTYRYLENNERLKPRLLQSELDGCHYECVEHHLDGTRYCNPVCNYVYTDLNFEPLISFKDSRTIFNIFLECSYLKTNVKALDGCVLALFKGSCYSCSKVSSYKIKALHTFLTRIITTLADGTEEEKNGINADEEWRNVMNIIVNKVHPNDNADVADVVYCFGTISWLSSLTSGTNFMDEGFSLRLLTEVYQIISLFVTRTNPETPVFNRPVLDAFVSLFSAYECSLLDTAVFYNNKLFPEIDPETSSSFHFMAFNMAQIINNLYVMFKSKPVIDKFIPIRFTESAFPIIESKLTAITGLLTQFGTLSFVWSVAYIQIFYNVIRMIGTDNKPKIQETLRIMNVPKCVLWSSIYSFYSFYFILLNLVFAVLAHLQYKASSYFFVFLLHFSFSLSLLSVGFFFSSLMASASPSNGANVGLIFYILAVVIEAGRHVSLKMETGAQYFRMLLPQSAFFKGHTILLSSEVSIPVDGNYQGTTFTNLPKYHGDSLLNIILFLIFDSVLYMLLALYISELNPGIYGNPQPWYFPLKISYWFPKWKKSQKRQTVRKEFDRNSKVKSTESKYMQQEMFEQDGVDVTELNNLRRHYWAILPNGKVVIDDSLSDSYVKPFIVADNIGKSYTSMSCLLKKDKFWAVSQSSFQVCPGEVFTLLGHNGAGKTTILSLLTGMIRPTEGFVQILGCDMTKKASLTRNKIGFVPQYSFFFPELTVREHLHLFCIVKSIPDDEIHARVSKIAQKFNIIHKMNSKAKVLSGGQKRSLSIAIAAVGETSVLLLDEPSTGMDPHTRRYFWQAIRELRRNRAIILTTHFLEEADRISDTIGILANARLCCFGSSHFLKQVYGAGYTCVILKKKAFNEGHRKLLLKALEGSTLVSEVALEIVLHIPFNRSSSISNALRLFEGVPKYFGIHHFSIKLTTLETVFFNVVTCAGESVEKSRPKKSECSFCMLGEQESLTAVEKASLQRGEHLVELKEGKGTSSPTLPHSHELEGVFQRIIKLKQKRCWLITQLTVILALLQKQWWKSKRNPWGFLIQQSIPILLVVGAVVGSKYLFAERNRRVLLDGSELSNYSYGTLTPSDVLIGASKNVSNTLMTSEEAANVLEACITSSYQETYKSRRIMEDFSSVQEFDQIMLDTWSGVHPKNQTLTRLFGSPKPRTIAFFMDSSMSFEKETESLVLQGLQNLSPSIRNITLNSIFPSTLPKPIAEGWLFHNGSDIHSVAVGYNMLASCVLMALKPGVSLLKIANYPFDTSAFMVNSALFIVMGIAILGGFWANRVVQEKHVGAKKSQHDAGVTFLQYWISMAISDFLSFEIVLFIIFGLLLLLDDRLVQPRRRSPFVSWMSICGCANVSFTYLVVLYVNDPMVSQILVTSIEIVVPVIVEALKLLPTTKELYRNFLIYAFRLIPTVTLLEGLSELFEWRPSSYFGIWDEFNLGKLIKYAVVQIVGFFAILLTLDILRARSLKFNKGPQKVVDWYELISKNLEKKNEEKNSNEDLLVGRADSKRSNSVCSYSSNKHSRTSLRDAPVSGARRRSSSIPMRKKDYFFKQRKAPMGEFHLLKESSLKYKRGVYEDADVVEEQEKIRQLVHDRMLIKSAKSVVSFPDKNQDMLLTVEGLTKVFNPPYQVCSQTSKVAVENVWFGVPKGQCFGLVGGNGAGKTTAMQMLTGRISPTSGRTCIDGVDISNINFKSTEIGYCPQFDSCFNELTGREHLLFYLLLAKIPSKHLRPISDEIIEAVDLKKCADRVVRTYSGGNRRKLAIALTFIHHPRVVILDEPSSGIDPVSRRKLWRTIARYTEEHQSATIITSHSMEECEALCDRIGIIQEGRLVCIGTPEHLRSRFGEAYQLEVTVNRNIKQHQNNDFQDDKMSCVTEAYTYSIDKALARFSAEFMNKHFPNAILIESVGPHQRWSIPKSTTTLSEIFFLCEQYLKLGMLKTYGVNEVSLEDVFLNFSKQAHSSMAKKDKFKIPEI